MVTPEFKDAYERLNPEQKMAVDTIEGPVMVVAGPGTGKTEVLTLRIANILLKTDTKPEQVLALTFTDSATTNMRKRLSKIIGPPAYRVRIQTFHSFCNDVLQSYPEYFPRVVGASPITEVESTSIIEKIIESEDLSILKPWGDPMLYLSQIIRRVEELKREGFSPEQFSDLVRSHSVKAPRDKQTKAEKIKLEKTLEKNKELALIYERYQEKLLEKRLYDWSDMILEVLKVLENPTSLPPSHKATAGQRKLRGAGELKLILQENHQYILVDEHQDTNDAQNKIIELLSDFHENPNIFVVGDSKQAIFRFQGASVSNFLHFKELFPKAVLIDLFRNYRSTQNILDSAHSVIPSETALKSELPRITLGTGIHVASFKNSNLEQFWIAEKLAELQGTSVIIYRSNKEAFPLALALRKAGISYVIESDEDLLGDIYVKKIITILQAVQNYGDDIYLAQLLHVEEMGLEPLEVYKLIRSARKTKKSIYELLTLDENPEIIVFREKLEKWVKDSKGQSLPEFIEQIFRESGIMESALKSRDAEAFLGVERLFEEAQKVAGRRGGGTLSDFVDYIETLIRHEILIKKPKGEAKDGVVRLMTAHRAKGLEFDNVFIINASEKSFGGRVSRELLPLITNQNHSSEDSLLDDEKRLFYVALTRAKKNIFITWHEYDEAGKEILPSSFISEIKPELREAVDTSAFEEKIQKDKRVLFRKSQTSGIREIDKEFVSELFYKEQFSVTALNNYLECPWKYFYRNLLRIPYAQAKYLLYGTAMHGAVEAFFKNKSQIEDEESQKEFLIKAFEKAMEEAELTETEMKETLARGKEALSLWHDERHSSWLFPYKVEQALYGVEFDEVRLSGKLDKLEFISDTEVMVTDYKTGKPKSRNDIEGLTRSSSKGGKGNLKRQLVFYKLLLSLYEDGKYNMTKGIIEFLEPNESGKIKWEEFEITDKEVDELKFTIEKVASEITSLSFWNSYCDDKECEYCGYRRLLEK